LRCCSTVDLHLPRRRRCAVDLDVRRSILLLHLHGLILLLVLMGTGIARWGLQTTRHRSWARSVLAAVIATAVRRLVPSVVSARPALSSIAMS
jgi:hypothetical protein